MENERIDYKSLKVLSSGAYKELAKHCVAFANAHGGKLVIGFEDKFQEPPIDQKIKQKQINDTLEKLRGFTYAVALSVSEILTHKNGGEYFEIYVSPSKKTIATTSDGKIFIRITDKSHPVRSEDIQRISSEKDAFQWELIVRNVFVSDVHTKNIKSFVQDIRNSTRVKNKVKSKTDFEILEHYNLIAGNQLTNLGVLWLGTSAQRAHLAYPITVQYVVYNSNDQKVRKIRWDDYTLNPKELLLSIEKEAIELEYSDEFPDGLFRKHIRQYAPEVLRELFINAFAHKSYLISADISIEVFNDYLSVKSPGGLPLGITEDNILHKTHRRNPHLIRVLHDLNLMEGEGSGYDLIYEKLSVDSKEFPIIKSDFDSVCVLLKRKIIDEDALRLTDFISRNYTLSSKEKIVVNLVAKHRKINSSELARILQLSDEERLQSWYAKLVEREVLVTHGQTKGKTFIINPKLITGSKMNIKPNLKTIEPYRIKALIQEDLKTYPNSGSSQIQERLQDIDIKEIRRLLTQMIDEGIVESQGAKKGKTYTLRLSANKN